MQNLVLPPRFGTKTTGQLQGEQEGSIKFFSAISSTSFLANSCFASGILYGLVYTGLQFGVVLMVCSANPEEPRSCEDREIDLYIHAIELPIVLFETHLDSQSF